MLNKSLIGQLRLTHFGLALIGLMWVVPFLVYGHPRPLVSFYGEWLAAILGLCAIFLLVTQRFWQQLKIPRIALLPVALVPLILLQYAIGRGVYFEQTLLFTLYLLWAALLIILGRFLREELGLPTLATALAAFLLLGAEISALLAILQHYSIHTFLDPFVLHKYSNVVTGNLGQANHLANYITLGLVSLALLYGRWKLRVWQLLLLAFPLLLVLVLSGSRSPWLYLPCMAVMAFLWQRRDKSCLPLLHSSLMLIFGFGLIYLAIQIPWSVEPHGNMAHVQRLVETGGASDSRRLSIWSEAWLIFTQNPLLGAGFGQYRWQNFQLGPVLQDANLSNLNDHMEHAHNLLLQFAAELGMAGLLILFATIALWLVQIYRAPRTAYHWWGCAVLTILAIHSMLEYPLWYTYFLGIAAFSLGVFDDSYFLAASRWKVIAWGRWLMLALLILGLLLLSVTVMDYRKLVSLYAAMPPKSAANGYTQQILYQRIHGNLISMRGGSLLLRPNVDNLLGLTGWDHIADKGALNERVMRYSPTSIGVYRQALLLALNGKQAEARTQLERAIWAYPKNFTIIRQQLEGLARLDADPAKYTDLLDFAGQAFQERQRVLDAKSAK